MNPPKLPALQALRALAAIMVLIGHVLAEAEHYFALSLPGDAIPWTRGVDIFFVISGFVITLSATRCAGQPLTFLKKRILRVVPLYYLFTTLMVVALLILPSAVKDTDLDPVQILSSYGFFPYARDDGRIAPVLSLGWTLNYEMFFYVLMAACMIFARPMRAITAVLITLCTLSLLTKVDSTALTFWTNPLMLEFLFGIALARLWKSGLHWPSPTLSLLSLTAATILLILLDPLSLPRFIAAGIPAMLLVAAATLFCPPIRLPNLTLGDSSYSLYLSHRFALRAATLLLLPLLPANLLGATVYVALTIGVAITFGLLTHHLVERPMMRSLTSAPQRSLA